MLVCHSSVNSDEIRLRFTGHRRPAGKPPGALRRTIQAGRALDHPRPQRRCLSGSIPGNGKNIWRLYPLSSPSLRGGNCLARTRF
jgi:hypothetical protein